METLGGEYRSLASETSQGKRCRFRSKRLGQSCCICLLTLRQVHSFLAFKNRRAAKGLLLGASTSFQEREIVWVDSLANEFEEHNPDTKQHAGRISILSWNILSQTLFDTSRLTGSFYEHVDGDDCSWDVRFPKIMSIIREADADIVCLQEAELGTYQRNIIPVMRSLGYEGIAQGEKGVKESKRSRGSRSPRSHIAVTFWKSDRLEPVPVHGHLARSRTLTSVFQCKTTSNALLAIVNCHLEGHPLKASARVRQLHHALRELSNRHARLQGLVVCGDFNCELHSSACSTYLREGSCIPHAPDTSFVAGVVGEGAMALPGTILEYDRSLTAPSPILEWGSPVPGDEIESVPSHPYFSNSMVPAFSPFLGQEDPTTHFTFAARPNHPVAGLDQIWYAECSLKCVALRRMLTSDADRLHILESGLPNDIIPSDHLPIGCFLEWQPELIDNGAGDLRELEVQRNKAKASNRILADRQLDSDSSSASPQQKAERLLENCPFENDNQRKEFDFVVRDIPLSGQPSPEQIAQLKARTARKKQLLGMVSDDVREVLLDVLKLKKEAAKLER